MAKLARTDNNQEMTAAMKEMTSMTKDPICGMTVDEASALDAERDGKTFYYCSHDCRQKFLSAPVGMKPEESPRARGRYFWCPSWCPFCASREEPQGTRLELVVNRVNGVNDPSQVRKLRS